MVCVFRVNRGGSVFLGRKKGDASKRKEEGGILFCQGRGKKKRVVGLRRARSTQGKGAGPQRVGL